MYTMSSIYYVNKLMGEGDESIQQKNKTWFRTISKGETVQAMKNPAPNAETNCVGKPAGTTPDFLMRVLI